jgi:adenylate kinase family enzyme
MMTANGANLGELSVRALADMISDTLWHDRLSRWVEEGKPFGVHVAIFSEPFLGYVLAGTKTVDSRFSKNRIAPYEYVEPGDIILIKQAGGPVTAVCSVERAWFYEIDNEIFKKIKDQFGRLICASEEFWRSRRERSYATLILLKDVRPVTPFEIEKKDRRGWVTLKKNKPDKPVVIAFAGPIGSGKTTISKALAKKIHSKHAGFGDYFRTMASRLGLDPSDRLQLQRLGEEQVRLSPDNVCRELLSSNDWRPSDASIVVDGVRHLEVLEALKGVVAPLPVFLVYVQRDKVRSTQLSNKVGKNNMELFEAHSTELQSNILRSSADIIVSAEDDPARVVNRVVRQLEESKNNDHARSRNRSSF